MTFENWWRSKYPTDISEIEFMLLRVALVARGSAKYGAPEMHKDWFGCRTIRMKIGLASELLLDSGGTGHQKPEEEVAPNGTKVSSNVTCKAA